jgi:Mg2+ and Co2+ transporter CorA
MKVLTIFSAVLLPMSVYTNMLAMTAAIPFGNHPSAFWIHTAFMLVIAAITVVIFKWKRWF